MFLAIRLLFSAVLLMNIYFLKDYKRPILMQLTGKVLSELSDQISQILSLIFIIWTPMIIGS